MGIWAKIGGALKTGAKTTKDVLLLVPKALIYPIKKPFASMSEAKHDAKVSLKGAVGIDVPEEEKKYDPPIETTEASEYLSIQITKQGRGKVSFLASRTLTGDVPHLSPEKLDEIRKNLPNITIFREENKIVIEVDVEGIIQEIKDKNPGMDEKAAKRCALEEIYNKVDCDLKNFAKITDGEFKVHTDRKLLYGIAEKLYKEYDNQKQSSEEVMVSNQSSKTETLASLSASDRGIEERYHSLTVPGDMYHLQPGVITARRANEKETFSKRQQIDYGSVLRGQDIQLKDVSSLEDVSSKAVLSSPSTPTHKQNRRGSRI